MGITKVGVFGVGSFGRHHARIYRDLERSELVGKYDIDADRAAQVAGLLGRRAFPSPDTLLAEVVAVSLATPTTSHASVAAMALSRGVHALVEKPIAGEEKEADAIIDTATASGAVLAVGHVERFNPAFAEAARGFDRLRFFRSERLGTWAGANTNVDVVMDLMIHDLDLLTSLDPSSELEVDASGSKVLSSSLDIANARILLESGAVAVLDASRLSAAKHRVVRLYSHDEYVSIDLLNRRAERARAERGEPPSIEREKIPVPDHEPLRDELTAFLEEIAGRKTRIASGEDGRRALILAKAVTESIECRH